MAVEKAENVLAPLWPRFILLKLETVGFVQPTCSFYKRISCQFKELLENVIGGKAD